jgi:hypothetical protein
VLGPAHPHQYPLAGLTTLNDSAYIDISRHFAYRMQTEAGSNVEQQIKTGFRLATYRTIDDKSLQSLMKLRNIAFNQFKNDTLKTNKMIGEKGIHANAETAALTVVANAILNLDEVLTKN